MTTGKSTTGDSTTTDFIKGYAAALRDAALEVERVARDEYGGQDWFAIGCHVAAGAVRLLPVRASNDA